MKLLYKLSVRRIGLTWNKRNQISDGAEEPTNCGLSEFRFEVVSEANKIGMVIDLAHISETGFWT